VRTDLWIETKEKFINNLVKLDLLEMSNKILKENKLKSLSLKMLQIYLMPILTLSLNLSGVRTPDCRKKSTEMLEFF